MTSEPEQKVPDTAAFTPAWWDALERSTNNPLVFVREVLGVEPRPWQARALQAVGAKDRVSIRSGHGIGKTTLLAWLVLWFMCTRRRCKVPVCANSQDQLRDTIWPEIARWHRKLPESLKMLYEVQKERVVLLADPESCFAVARTASKENPEALQGFHEDNLMFLFDEASGIPDVVFEVGMGALSTPGAKVVMTGNPTRNSGMLFDSHHRLRDRWHCMHVSCLNVKEAQGHIDDVKSKYGDNSNAWRVRVLGEFPTADDETIIPLELVRAAVNRDVATLDYYPVWGLDVARFGDDRTALAKRLQNKLLEPVKSRQNYDTIQVVGWLKNEYLNTEEYLRPSAIMVDAIGIGAGVYDLAKLERLPVRAVNVGEAAPSRDNCMRLRDELWYKGREWFQERICSIPDDEDLIAELTTPTYTFSVTGKIIVERKDDLKKRGMRSPDLADAFLLTFAGGLKRRSERKKFHTRYGGSGGGPTAWSS